MIAGATCKYRLQKHYFHKNGSIIWVNTTVSLVKDANNNPAYFIAIVEDITDWKNTQIELKKEKRFIEQTVNSSLAGIYNSPRNQPR
jgi:two-component system sensor histidine kinase/response regulator